MKKILFPALALLAVLTITGCPVGIAYPPGEPGSEAIDKKLIGTWTCQDIENPIQKAEVKKGDDNSYKIEIVEKGEMYALETTTLTGWVTEIEGHKLMYAKPQGEENYYTISYEINDGVLSTWDVSLLVNGVDGITSTEAFRDEIKASMDKPDFLSGKSDYLK